MFGPFCKLIEPSGKTDCILIRWLFLRLIALIYFAAFSSLAGQIIGLVGADGILPLREYLDLAQQTLGPEAYWRIPTLFWLNASDLALSLACLAGLLASTLVLIGIWTRAGLFLCYGLYLSLTYAGQSFMSFQWDMLLMECGFLAILLPGNSLMVPWLYRFLLFRFMLMGGVVKLASGDPSWQNLTALFYHFETQPLPSPLAWYAHQLPDGILLAATAAVFFIELAVPFFVFLSRPFKLFAAASFVVLQSIILLTGNYNFFNLLVIALCLFLLEDRDVKAIFSTKAQADILAKYQAPSHEALAAAAMMAFFVLSVCGGLLWMTTLHRPAPQPIYAFVQFASTLGLVNGYGPFAVMTTERQEIIVEGSDDGENWLAYEFKYKPGDIAKPLSWNIPHQPRLDWQMWFAALGEVYQYPWFLRFMHKLQQGSAPVLALLEKNPFPKHPPRFIRTSLYHYQFTTREARKQTGQIWKRAYIGDYFPEMH